MGRVGPDGPLRVEQRQVLLRGQRLGLDGPAIASRASQWRPDKVSDPKPFHLAMD
jgi:hypothetical protein